MRTVALTLAVIRDLRLPDGVDDAIVFDKSLRRFGVRMRRAANGPPSKTYVIQYRNRVGKTRKYPIGLVSDWDLGKARAEARRLFAYMLAWRKGDEGTGDPVQDKAAARAKVNELFGGEVLDRYLEAKKTERKFSTYDGIKRALKVHCVQLHDRPLDSIELADISRTFAHVETKAGRIARNRVRSALNAYFNWAGGEGLVKANPVGFSNKTPENQGKGKPIPMSVLAEIWHAARGMGYYTPIVHLLMLTGARRDMIAALRHSEIDWGAGTITIPPERTGDGSAGMKGNRPFTLPITPPVRAILEQYPQRLNKGGKPRDLVFGSYSNETRAQASGFTSWGEYKRKINTKINAARAEKGIAEPVPYWRHHWFRHSFSTTMNKLVPEKAIVIEECLAHRTHNSGVRGIYNDAEYSEEKAEILTAWQNLLLSEVNKGFTPPKLTMVETYRSEEAARAPQQDLRKKYIVKLTAEQRAELAAMISAGLAPARQLVRAQILLKTDADGEAWRNNRIVTELNTGESVVLRVIRHFVNGGLDAALGDKISPAMKLVTPSHPAITAQVQPDLFQSTESVPVQPELPRAQRAAHKQWAIRRARSS
jgi:integrase